MPLENFGPGNPIALKTAKTPWSFGRSECNRRIEVLHSMGILVFEYRKFHHFICKSIL